MTFSFHANAEDVERLSEAALALSAKHATPPIPEAYEVWYTYASAEQEALNAHIDKALQAGPLDAEDMRRIHDRFFSAHHLQSNMSELGVQLEARLDGLCELAARGTDDGEETLASLRSLAGKLSRTDGSATIAPLVARISALNETYMAQTRQLAEAFSVAREEVTRLKADLNDLQKGAYIDHLTQLSNRRHFDTVITTEMKRARSEGHPLCVAIADIDHFKKINDQYGHAFGDIVLAKFSEIIRKNIKGRDTSARIGGEEFALILPNTSLTGAVALAETLRGYFSAVRIMDKKSGQRLGAVTVSFGVAQLEEHDDVASLIRRADDRLYDAKRAGRNQVKSGGARSMRSSA